MYIKVGDLVRAKEDQYLNNNRSCAFLKNEIYIVTSINPATDCIGFKHRHDDFFTGNDYYSGKQPAWLASRFNKIKKSRLGKLLYP